jgi:hypothetical protein
LESENGDVAATVSLLLLFLVPHAEKDVGVVVPLAAVGTYMVVRAYYAKSKKTGTCLISPLL